MFKLYHFLFLSSIFNCLICKHQAAELRRLQFPPGFIPPESMCEPCEQCFVGTTACFQPGVLASYSCGVDNPCLQCQICAHWYGTDEIAKDPTSYDVTCTGHHPAAVYEYARHFGDVFCGDCMRSCGGFFGTGDDGYPADGKASL